jgi:peptidyl-prolyl cis-trans isomerase SurA
MEDIRNMIPASKLMKSTLVVLFVGGLSLLTGAAVSRLTTAQSGNVAAVSKPSKSAKKDKGDWVMKSTACTVALPEFEEAYKRMNDKNPYATTFDSLDEFLHVYASYRLKLEDAAREGMNKDPKIIDEIKGYRHMLAGPYLLDKEVTEPALRKLFERRQIEVHAGHFLAQIHNERDPGDTLKAYKRAVEAIHRLNNGESMTLVTLNPGYRDLLANEKPLGSPGSSKNTPKDTNAWQGSDDKGSASIGGDLGFFTGGMTVRSFEDAAYGLNPGEYTKVPVRTHFGYHVIETYEKVPRIGGVKLHQIIVNMPSMVNDTAPYWHRIDSLYMAIQAGANFEQVARESSEDKKSGKDGGDIGYINREDHRAPLPVDRAAYALKDGEISGIVRSQMGYHIFKRVGTIPAKTYEQEKESLKQLYKKYYFNEDKDKYMTSLKTKDDLRIDSANINYFIAHIDSSKTSLDSSWSKRLTTADRSKTIYRLTDENWTIGSLEDSLVANPGSPLARSTLYDLINKRIEDDLLDIAAKDIDTKYPEFEKIMQDYKNGIILFELENKRVWSKVVPDSAMERKYYQEHSAKFLWPERVDISEIFVTSDSLAKSLYKRVIAGEDFDSIAKKYTERPGYKEKAGHWGLLQKDETELARRAFDFVVGEVKAPFNFQGGYSIVKLNRRDPIHEKTFEEARQEVASQYQDDRASQLRADWVEALRKKYKLQLNEKLLKDAWEKNHGLTDASSPSSSGAKN